MGDKKPIAHVAPVEMLTEWEGPAVHAPGVVVDEKQVERMTEEGDVAGIVSWIAVRGLSGIPGNPDFEAIRTKVRGVLSAWRQRHGQMKLDELKQHLLLHLQPHRKNAKLSEQELRK